MPRPCPARGRPHPLGHMEATARTWPVSLPSDVQQELHRKAAGPDHDSEHVCKTGKPRKKPRYAPKPECRGSCAQGHVLTECRPSKCSLQAPLSNEETKGRGVSHAQCHSWARRDLRPGGCPLWPAPAFIVGHRHRGLHGVTCPHSGRCIWTVDTGCPSCTPAPETHAGRKPGQEDP